MLNFSCWNYFGISFCWPVWGILMLEGLLSVVPCPGCAVKLFMGLFLADYVLFWLAVSVCDFRVFSCGDNFLNDLAENIYERLWLVADVD